MNFKSFFPLLLIFFSSVFSAQQSDLGAWYMFFGNSKINPKWNAHYEVQYRNFNAAGDLEQLLIRTGLGYDLTENNNNVLLGYAFILSKPYIGDEKVDNIEHRIFQQFITKQKISFVNLQHRYRLEERFLEDDFKMRFRYNLGITVPLNSKDLNAETVYLSAYNEIFLNLDRPVFDRNRVYGAVGYAFSKNWRAELGYMNQIQENKNRGQVQVGIYGNIPFFAD